MVLPVDSSNGTEVVSKPASSTNTAVVTQPIAVDSYKQEEEQARAVRERKSWEQLIKTQPHSLRLKRFPELRDWTILRELPQLHTLDVSGSSFADGDIGHLKKLPVRNLDLTGVTITGNVDLLKDCPSLIALNLSGNKLSAKDLADLNIGIRDLILDNCEITDLGISKLSHLPKLRNLSLRHTPITDASVSALSNLTLDSLNIDGTSISSQGINLLKKNLPKCTIFGE